MPEPSERQPDGYSGVRRGVILGKELKQNLKISEP